MCNKNMPPTRECHGQSKFFFYNFQHFFHTSLTLIIQQYNTYVITPYISIATLQVRNRETSTYTTNKAYGNHHDRKHAQIAHMKSISRKTFMAVIVVVIKMNIRKLILMFC